MSYTLALVLEVAHLLKPNRVLRIVQQVAMAAGLAAQWWFGRAPDLASGGQDRDNDAVAVEARSPP